MLELIAGWMMSRQSPLSREGSKNGCKCNWCGGRNFGSFSKDIEETSSPVGDDDNLGEKWFNRENSQAEC